MKNWSAASLWAAKGDA